MHKMALPENAKARDALREKLKSLKLPTVKGESSSPFAQQNVDAKYNFSDNSYGFQSVTLEFKQNATRISMQNKNGERQLAVGFETWENNQIPFISTKPEPVAASGAWVTPDQFRVKVYAYETPYMQQIDFHFMGDRLLFNLAFNVSFGDREWEQLEAIHE